ncbi:GNAT family N-acetyltransferase [Alkalihalobacillus sp. AL-G]|uniref:GNAT family N-acetyltransferase n=1 Tax=Alkalihalobacillus sp. AL-G TaxID=2926399 RepID=UPI00272BBFA6|nr:GNAT family N-acetyltransferase [Alkalihalobacillus sp. AL-G]WLD92572.1 GNAT family N-acetyltransferase [Alkalihalobacillus sp. AL-G]
MNQIVDQIRIVEYDPSYAAAVAEMWNNSRDGWGGGNSIQTEEQVLKQEANSTNLHLYLALDGEKVVGYCSLGEYREDEGALYIPLLNVRGDYHGKKIGKMLLLKALERSIEMKWPRLDLYTWPGNTKAVPLYKKCGFFWEERDDATHLMNFMPTVLHTEAVQDFFKDLNWYEASTRTIEVKPDGNKENDFHYYEYSWSNEGRLLKMEFERFGRGLRSIETDDYQITATIEDFKLVFGSEYKIRYHIKNKTGNPLTISFQGQDNSNIRFSFGKAVEVDEETTVEAPFFVGKVEEEQSIWRTHPTVNTTVKINGKQASFKVGLMPKFPANVECHITDNLTFVGKTASLYVDIVNNYKEEVAFSFSLPESDLMQLDRNKVEVTLEPKSRCSVPIRYTLKKHGFYSPEIKVTATKQDGSSVTFTKKIAVAFKGIGAGFTGESEDMYHVYNGQYHMWLEKFDNWLIPGKEKTDDQDSAFIYPKLGKPFSEEFSKIRAERVEFFEGARSVGYKATYQSKAFPEVKLNAVAKLYSEGLIELHYEVENIGEDALAEELWLNNPIFHNLERAVIPYENKLVEMKDSIGTFHEYWKGDSVTENWIFSRDSDNPRGICWSSYDKINFGGWFVYFEHRIGRLKGKESVKTNPVFMTIGAFQDWHSFREFARQQSVEKEPLTDHLAFEVNGDNPFVFKKQSIPVRVTDYKASYFNGTIDIRLDDTILKTEKFTKEDTVKTKEFSVEVEGGRDTGILSSHIILDSIAIREDSLFIKKGSESVRYETGEKEGISTYSCSNGPLEISVAPDYYPSLFSLKANGREWLDSSFPKVHPKSWWNPWPGGIGNSLRKVSPNSILKEKRHTEFATVYDTKGNKWEGLKVVVKLREHEKYKGFEFHQYFLLLPGSPVLCQTTEIIQNAGRFMDMKNWDTYCFFNPSDDSSNAWGNFQNVTGEWQKVYGGKGEQEIRVGRNVVFGADDHEERLQIISDMNEARLESYINKEVMMLSLQSKLNIEHGRRFFTTPVFFKVGTEVVEDRALDSLKSIRF